MKVSAAAERSRRGDQSRARLAIVVPCFNEAEVLPESAGRLGALLTRLRESGYVTADSGIFFIDDGSTDATWNVIEGLTRDSSLFKGIKLSRNRGHQAALLAGLMIAPGDAIVSIDADLQDDAEAIAEMLAFYRQGADVVYGVRNARPWDTAFKRWSARAFYRMLDALGVEIVTDHADFRLMSRPVIDALRQYEETNLFLRALVPQLGFRTATVPYQRGERLRGESKYPLTRMISFALEGVTSFSVRPLRLITLLGFVVSLFSFGLGLWALVVTIGLSKTVPGWASTVVPMFFLGGVQLLSVGVVGEYVGKIYTETKRRPRFIVERTTWSEAAPPLDKGRQTKACLPEEPR